MATSFPTGLDALTNPTSADGLNSPDHAGQHANVNDAIEAIEAQIGITSAPVLARLASPTFTGTPLSTTASVDTNTTQIATTAYVVGQGYAKLASPTFTGTVTGNPTAGTTTTAAGGIGYMGLPQNATTTGAYTIVAADAGKHIYSTATRTVTIPSNASVAMPVGSTIVFIAATGATVTIAITTDTMYLAGPGTTGSRTLAAFGMATAVKITSTSWIISGNGLT